jgi:hypothetical protein
MRSVQTDPHRIWPVRQNGGGAPPVEVPSPAAPPPVEVRPPSAPCPPVPPDPGDEWPPSDVAPALAALSSPPAAAGGARREPPAPVPSSALTTLPPQPAIVRNGESAAATARAFGTFSMRVERSVPGRTDPCNSGRVHEVRDVRSAKACTLGGFTLDPNSRFRSGEAPCVVSCSAPG